MASKNAYDLIFVDIFMPGIDGFETTMLIRQYETQQNLEKKSAIFALTAGGIEGLYEKCRSVGMNGFFVKPLQFPQVNEEIAKKLLLSEKQVFFSFFLYKKKSKSKIKIK